MVAQLITTLELPISKARLEAYRLAGGSDLEMLVTYLWNVELSEALYPTFQVFEVTLRNGIHAAASAIHRSEFWFDEQGVLLPRQAEAVQKVRDNLTDYRKPPTAGRIIAGLSFGFWTTLLNRPYEGHFWHANELELLHAAFEHLPRYARNRGAVWKRCNAIRLLRNRVMHYEHIWDRPALDREHRQILEAIGWISPEMRDVVGLCDRFSMVFSDGRLEIERRLRDRFGIS